MSTVIWHTRPVFITSTFRDMHAERDHLHNFVFPALEERLRERFHHLEPIDLRWGVETVGADGQHAKEMLVLKVCLNEIERSRPFLIALLGERYGWIPPEERMTQAAREAGYGEELTGHSVTALEIEYGVLNSADQHKRSFFYFRNPLPCHEMGAETAAIYSDQYSPDPEGKQAHQRLIELKTRIAREHPERVRHYQAEWDREKNCVTGLETWGRIVLEDLWNELDAETAELANIAEATWEQQERWALETFIESRSRDFVGRENLLEDLIALATSVAVIGDDWGASITGPAGGGKSSLIAQLSKKLQNDDYLLLTHSAGISPRSIQVEHLLRRWVDELTQAIGIKNPLTDQTTAEELEKTFHEMLGRGAAKKRVIILFDALNQFDNSPQARHLTWLPKRLPTNSRLIVTAIPCTASETLRIRQGIQSVTLQPLDQTEAVYIIKAICSRYHRKLNPKVQQILLNKRDSNGQPSSGIPLWLTLALEELNLLDADDFARAQKQYTGTGEEKLLKLLLDTTEQLPGDVDDLYGWLLSRAEDVHGREWTQAFVNLIAVSRTGWRESDLKTLMPNESNIAWSELNFAALRRSFRAHVVQRGSYGQWDFSHAQMQIAVYKRSLADQERTRKLHATVADYLLSLQKDDALHENETMVHLIGADDKSRATSYYGGDLTRNELRGATLALADYLLSGEQVVDGPELTWVKGLVTSQILNENTIYQLCNRLVFSLDNALANQGRLRMRLDLLLTVSDELILLDVSEQNSWITWLKTHYENAIRHPSQYFILSRWLARLISMFLYTFWLPQPDVNQTLRIIRLRSACLNEMGNLALLIGDARALQWFQRSLEIRERQVSNTDEYGDYQSLAFAYIGMGKLICRQSPAKARQWFHRSLKICEEIFSLDPGYRENLRELAIACNNLGDMDRSDSPAKALLWYQRSLEIAEKLIALEPDNTLYLRDLSISCNRMGDVDGQQDPQTTRLWYLKSLEIVEKLSALEPDSTLYRHDLSISFIRMGNVDGRLDPQKAREWYEKGLEIANKLVALEPDSIRYLRDLSIYYNNMGNIERHQDSQKAREWYEKELEIAEKLVAIEPDNTEDLRDLSISFNNIGNIDRHQDPQKAREWYEKGLAIAEKMVALDPGNTLYLRDLSLSFDRMGDMDNRRDPQKAREWYEKELEIVEKLVALEPDNTLYLHYLYLSFDRMGDIDGRQEPKKAREWYEKELEIAKKLVALEPENTEYLTDLSLSFNNIGNINGCQDPQKARQWYKKELEIAKKLVALEPDNSKLLRYLASSLSLIAETFLQQNMTEAECEYSLRAAEAMNRAAKLTPDDPYIQYGVACACARVGERGKALAALALSIELGNTNAKQSAEDPDLASLRELPEFESLLERMRQAGE